MAGIYAGQTFVIFFIFVIAMAIFDQGSHTQVIDGCEYVSVGHGNKITHKGNCTNVIHRTAIIENQ